MRLLDKETIIDRQRIHSLLKEAIESPLVTIIAPAGYGKSIGVSTFMEQSAARVSWKQMTILDNLPESFWISFTRVLSDNHPALYENMRRLGFPDSIQKFDYFIRLLAREAYEGEQIIIVLDDYHHIVEPDIHKFVKNLVEIALDNFTLVVMSKRKLALDLSASIHKELWFNVSSDDLRFDRDEVVQLIATMGIEVEDKIVDDIYSFTEGWPWAVYLLVNQVKSSRGELEVSDMRQSLDLLMRIFDEEFFAQYSSRMKYLFIQLSLLEHIPLMIISQLVEDPHLITETMGLLDANLFVYYDPRRNVYVLHNLFKEFLYNRQFWLKHEDKHKVYIAAAEYYHRRRMHLEAITYYDMCERYDMLIEVMRTYPNNRLSKRFSDFLIEKIEQMPAEYLQQRVDVRYLQASLYLNVLELDVAWKLFMDLKTELEAAGESGQAYLAEVYLSLGDMCFIKNSYDLTKYYKLGAQLLPHGSEIRSKELMLIENTPVLFLASNEPGELDRLQQAFFDAMPEASLAMNGVGYGIEYLVAAEVGYYTCDMAKTEENAYRAIYRSQEEEQHDIYCNAQYLLMRMAVCQGDYKRAVRHLELVKECVEQNHAVGLYTLQQSVESHFYIDMGDLDRVARWIVDEDASIASQYPITAGRDRLVKAMCLVEEEKYVELTILLEQLERLFEKRGQWLLKLYGHYFAAFAYFKLGRQEEALISFGQAYAMAYHNDLIMPFVEGGNRTRFLVDSIRHTPDHGFDEKWLDLIYRKSSTFGKRLATVRKDFAKEHQKSVEQGVRLSRRESEVLNGLAQGLTRQEIAEICGITVNTVKSTIKQIYNKLGAVNRADAIRIATSLGYIE